MEANLPGKTGKTLEQWKVVLADKGFNKHGDIMTYLKQECGVTHGFANFISLKFRAADAASHSADDLVDNQYCGKASLRPIFEKLKADICVLGDDIEMIPKKSAVSFKRKRQFVLVRNHSPDWVEINKII